MNEALPSTHLIPRDPVTDSRQHLAPGANPAQELFAQLLVAQTDAERLACEAFAEREKVAALHEAAKVEIAQKVAQIEALEAELAELRRPILRAAWRGNRLIARLRGYLR